MARRGRAFLLEDKGLKEMADRLSPQNRKKALRIAMREGGSFVQKKVQTVYREAKPTSTLYNAIVLHLYPSGEGAIVRRAYIKGGSGKLFEKNSDLYRAYILNFVEKGTGQRKTKKGYNRGGYKGIFFFRKGVNRARNTAINKIRAVLLAALEKQAKGDG